MHIENSIKDFIGKRIRIYACRYFYDGVLAKVNDNFYKLENVILILESKVFDNSLNNKKLDKDSYQKMPNPTFISTDSVEMLCESSIDYELFQKLAKQ